MTALAETVRPALAPGVRLHFDKRRNGWLLLAPERVIEMDGPAPEVLKRCDGTRTLGAIIDELASAFAADRQVIADDVGDLLAGLAAKRLLRLDP